MDAGSERRGAGSAPSALPGRAARLVALVLALQLFAPAAGVGSDLTRCEMEFTLSAWSAVYRSVKGEGTITCDNGQSARVKLRAWAAGLTVGKSEVLEGTAKFSGAKNIRELFASYALAQAHAGVVKSADAQALTKGEISMAMAGTGRGVDLGISFGRFKIKPISGGG